MALAGDTLQPQVSFLLVCLHTAGHAPAHVEPRLLRGGLTSDGRGCQFSRSHRAAEGVIRGSDQMGNSVFACCGRDPWGVGGLLPGGS